MILPISLTTASSGCKRRAGPGARLPARSSRSRAHLFTTRAVAARPTRGRRRRTTALGRGRARARRRRRRSSCASARCTARRSSSRAASRARPTAAPDADIIVSDDPALALAVQAADCVPLLIADRRTGAVAAAHAGWRGLAAACPRRRSQALAREFGSRPADLIAAVGPSIGACCYEVGADVRERSQRAGSRRGRSTRWFSRRPQPTRGNPSMPGARAGAPRRITGSSTAGRRARDQLEAAGVPARRRFSSPELCTASHPDAVLLVSRDGSRRPGRHRPARDQVAPRASSIAALASRSACAFNSRPTCSKVTRPISCASSRAFACSGCSPAFFTL